jgi:predicted amidophosphoribosyltransferase
MALRVVTFVTYLTNVDIAWRDEDHAALKFVKAVKGRTFGGYAWEPVVDKCKRLNQGNADDAIDWFAKMAAAYLQDHTTKVVLTPIPNSHCTQANGEIPRTTGIAAAVATRLGIEVLDCLRWKEGMLPSSHGGTRNPQELYDNLVDIQEPAKSKIILIDDVHTTGSHLVAAKAYLRAKKATCVMAVCAGRTVWAPQENPFAILEEDLPDFEPTK